MLLQSKNQFPLNAEFGGDEFAPNYHNKCGKCATRVIPDDLFGIHLDEMTIISAEEAFSVENDEFEFTEVPLCGKCSRDFSDDVLFSIY